MWLFESKVRFWHSFKLFVVRQQDFWARRQPSVTLLQIVAGSGAFLQLHLAYATQLGALLYCRRRPYRVECTGSLPTSEVKRRRARLVLGWGTAREVLRVLTAFASRRPVFQLPPRMTTIMLPTFRANALLLARPRVSSFQVDALFQVASCSPGGSLINAVPDASCKAPPSLKSNPKPSNSHPATSQCRIIRWPHASGEAKAM